MKKIILVLISIGALVACDEIKGVLSTTEVVTLKSTKNKQVDVAPGQHEVEISVNEKQRYIEVDFDRVNGFELVARFHFDEATTIPHENGDFFIDAGVSGQSVHLDGQVRTKVERSDLHHGWEDCQDDGFGGGCYIDRNGRQHCDSRWGSREVEYYIISTTRTLDVTLVSPATHESLGHLAAKAVGTKKDYVYKGFCRSF